jgi:hypothetical protein
MKKLFSLVLVLCMVGFASAGLIDVVMTGYQDVDQSGTISPSDIILLQIVNNIPNTGGTGLIAYDLDLHVSGPGILSEVNGGPAANHQADDWGGMGWAYSGIAPANVIAKMGDAWLFSFANAGTLIGGLAIHCEGFGPVNVDLTLGVGGGGYGNPTQPTQLLETDLGDLVIEQVPEPATIALLCLGGLLLRKRS